LRLNKKLINKIATSVSILLIASIFYSCKDDDAASPVLSSGTELYYLDSVHVRTSGTDTLSALDVFNCYEYSIREVKIKFTGETNIDSVNGICAAAFTLREIGGSQIVTYHDYNGITTINQHYEYTVLIPQSILQWSAQFRVRILAGYNSESKYIKLKDISIIKLNP
jgi:hypothetical protein